MKCHGTSVNASPLNRGVGPHRMRSLELKVPPPVVALLIGGLMWAISLVGFAFSVAAPVRVACTVAAAVIGGIFSLAGVLAFRRARTTVNPLKPETTSALVTGGIYRFTRNPMYVGLLFFLVAWAAYLLTPFALLGPLLFKCYITRFQILPEEKVLIAMFGSTFSDYQMRVRRWL